MQTNKMQIVRMNEDLLSQIAKIEETCFAHPWSYDSLKAELYKDDAYFFAAVIEGKAVGYIGMNTVLDEGYIANVAVLPEYRERGIGQRLISYIILTAEENNLSFVTLEVRKSNEKAISLYRKNGFKEVGERKNFYSEPTENALLMTLFLNGGDNA